jgi:predicted MFS family arabinose efflux permease
LPDSSPNAREPRQTLTWRLGVAALGRLVFNTAGRFAYPFAPALSRGLAVPLTSITSLLAASQVTGMFGLVSGPLCDRWGRRRMMLVGAAMLAGGMLFGGALPIYGGVLLALFLAGLGKSVYDPAVQAYVGESVPYERRGRAIGLIEFSWAGSSLLGVPFIALLIHRLGWRSPFFLLGGVGLLSAIAVMMLFPSDSRPRQSADIASGLWQAWRRLSKESAARYALGFGLLISAASQNLFVVYGVWMEEAFGLSIVALGTTSLVIGVGELLGEGLTASISDRLGLKRAVVAGSVLLAMSYAWLPWIGRSLSWALVGLFIIFLSFEFTVVTAMSLVTEILPSARATMMSGFSAANSLGRVIGATIGGLAWLAGGLTANGLVAMVITTSALFCLLLGLRDWQAAPYEIT